MWPQIQPGAATSEQLAADQSVHQRRKPSAGPICAQERFAAWMIAVHSRRLVPHWHVQKQKCIAAILRIATAHRQNAALTMRNCAVKNRESVHSSNAVVPPCPDHGLAHVLGQHARRGNAATQKNHARLICVPLLPRCCGRMQHLSTAKTFLAIIRATILN